MLCLGFGRQRCIMPNAWFGQLVRILRTEFDRSIDRVPTIVHLAPLRKRRDWCSFGVQDGLLGNGIPPRKN